MKRSRLDERQQQEVSRTGEISFYVMFGICTAVILIQLILEGSLRNVIGETIVLFAGGITCLAGGIKNGIWSRTNRDLTPGQNLFGSILFSAVFSIFYAAALGRKAGDDVNIAKYVVFFFLGITALCFLCLTILGKTARRKKRNLRENIQNRR